MARTRRSIQPLDLYKYDVLIEEKGMRSDYFKITQFDGYFYGGRNAFLLAGSGVFRPNSKILVEILNKEGQTVYSVPVASYVEGNSRLVQVEVYSDTPIGPGKIVIMGSVDAYIDGTPVPEEWKGKYNVRWVSDVIISPLVQNKTPIRFDKTPSLFVNEKFYASPSSSQFTETVIAPIDLEVSPKFYNVFPNGYILKLKNTSPTSFSSDFVGGKISGSITFSGSFGLETANIDLPITKIYNKNIAETEGNLIYTQRNTLVTSIFLSSSATYSSSINSQYSTVVSSNVNLIYSKLDTEATGSSISFTEVRIVDLETISGEIHKVRLSYKSSTAPGEYVLLTEADTGVRELFAIDSGSTVIGTGDFSKISIPEYWYTATMSLTPDEQVDSLPQYYYSSSLVNSSSIYKNNIDIIDGVSATPTIVDNKFIDNKSYFIGTSNLNFASLFPRSEYTLTFSAFANRVTGSQELSQTNCSMEVYLVSQENSDSFVLGTDPRGQLLGKITPTSNFKKQNFEKVEFNFVPKITKSGKYGLRFIVFGGHWSISNVSVKPAEEPFFSPDEVNLLVPLENQENDILTFRAEFYDVTNNSSGIDIFSIPTYITGSSNYVKKTGDFMTGELYINGLPMQQQALQDGFTGLVSGGVITVNTPASWSYTISSGSGYVIDNYTNPLNPTYTYVTWPQISKMPVAFTTTGSIAAYPRTNIAISASGQVIEQSAEWTALDYRNYIILGRIAHVGTTSIQRALSLPLTTYNRGFHWFDLANAIGILNVEGNVFYASGSSMSIGKTAGKTYRVGSNYRNNTAFPDITTDPASLPTTFAYRYRSGSLFAETPLTTIVSGNLYDNGSGVPQTVNPNKFTIQRIYYFGATNTVRIQLGQNVYDTLVDAQSSADAEVFVADPNLDRDSSLRAYLIVGSSATDLSNPSDAEFITIGKFGAGGTGGGGGGGATALSGLTDVNLNGVASGQLLQYNGTVWVNGTNVNTLATTGSNNFVGNQLITGSLTVSGSSTLTNIGPAIFSGSLTVTGGITGSLLGTGSWASSASIAVTSSYIVPSGLPVGTVSSSVQINTGSFSGSFTGNVAGTSSWGISSSFASSASFALSSSRAITSSLAITSSFATTASAATSITFTPATASFSTTSSYIIPSGLPIGIVSSSGQVDHNTTTNYVANQHIDHTGVSIIAGNGLVGGGTIAASRTLTALYIPSTDARSVNNPPATASAGLYADFKTNTTDGLVDGGTYHGVLTFRPYGTTSDFSGGPAYQEGFTENGNLYLRSGSLNTWSSWRKLAYETGSLLGTASFASTASVAISASWAPAAGLTGGTTNYIPLWTGTGTLSSSAIFQSTGNVGVGTTTPQKVLEVISPANDFVSVGVSQMGLGQWSGIHFGYREGNTSYRKSAIVFERTDLTGPNAQGKVHILNGPQAGAGSATLSDARLTIAENGNVGIGTSNPQVLLDITGSNPTTRVLGASGTTPKLTLSSAGVSAWSFRVSGSDSSFRLDQDGTDRITVLNGGNVGIGTNNPGQLLQLGSGNTSANLLRLSLGYDTSRTTRAGIEWNDTTNTTARISTEFDGALVSLQFGSLYNAGYNSNTVMTIRGNGNVGIGNTSPDTNLSVVKSSGGLPASTGTTPTTAITRIKASANNAMFMGMDVASPYGGWIQVSDITGLGTNYPILLNPNGGNVGVGISSPVHRLDVSGSTRLGVGGDRPTIVNTNGLITTQGDIGGWAFGHHALGSSGADRGGFGFLGSANNLTYYYIGADYVTPTMVITSGSNGNVIVGGTNAQAKLTVFSGDDPAISYGLSVGKYPRQLVMGYNTASNYGFLISTQTGVGYTPLALQQFGGNVGIGTTSPSRKLQIGDITPDTVNSDLNASLAVNGGIIIRAGDWLSFDQGYAVHGRIRYDSSATSTENALKIDSYYGHDFQTRTGISRMVIRGDTGNVGIGTISPANSSKLDVADGKIRAGTATSTAGTTIIEGAYSNGAITTLGTEYSSGGPVLGYGVTPSTASADSFFSSTGINATRGAYVIAGNVHKWSMAGLSTTTVGSVVSLTEYMRLTAAGNLGIGTNNPSSKLEVIGNALIGQKSNSSTAARLDITAGGSTFDSIIDLGFYDTFDAGVWYLKRHGADSTFRIANAGSGTEIPVITINTSNNVGIGTTNPQTKLDISGSGGIRHTSGSVSALLRANPTSNAVEFGAETFHVVNMLINGSSLYQFGVGAFLATNPAYTLGTSINPWATVYSSAYSSSISNAVGYFGTASFAVSASWAPSAGSTPQTTTSGGPLNIYIAQTFGGF